MTGKELRKALKKGDCVYGTAMISQTTLWPGILASAGLDFVFIDTEHTPLDRGVVSAACHLYKAHHIAPVVRIPSPDPYQATMVLDGGASGVIAPYIETANQVRQLVGAVKYKPLKGDKLRKFLDGDAELEVNLKSYLDNQNEGNTLIVNIESTPALEVLDDILSVKGLDGVLVGPHDLTCSLGIPEQYQHPLFLQTIETIIRKARARQVGVGIHVWDAVGFELEIKWAQLGANLIVHSNDLSLLSSTLKRDLVKIKGALGEEIVAGQENAHTI